MKITFREGGGFGGLVRGCEMDASSLPGDAAAALGQLVAGGQPPGRSPRGARDLVRYEISVDTGKGVKNVTFDDLSVPATVRPLLVFLKSRSAPRPPA